MNNLIILVILGAVICTLYLFFNEYFHKFCTPTEPEENRLPYKRKPFLMNVVERKFFEDLESLIPENFIVLPQVVLSSIVLTTANKQDYTKYRNMIKSRIIDYVVFQQPYYKPVLAIEYDGKTHQQPKRIDRDSRIDEILKSANIGIIHVKHQEKIDYKNLSEAITKFLKS